MPTFRIGIYSNFILRCGEKWRSPPDGEGVMLKTQNKCCSNCLCTQRFQDLGSHLVCQRCSKRLERITPEEQDERTEHPQITEPQCGTHSRNDSNAPLIVSSDDQVKHPKPEQQPQPTTGSAQSQTGRSPPELTRPGAGTAVSPRRGGRPPRTPAPYLFLISS